MSQAGQGVPGPASISLVEVGNAHWDDEAADALVAPLPGLGFDEAGFFDLDLLGGVRLQAWVHPEQGLYSVVYTSPKAGTWADMVTKYVDGTSLTYSNSPHGGRLRQRSGHENVYFPGTGTGELYRKMIADRPARPTRRLERADFRGDFERAFAEDIAWRNSPEGFDPAAITPTSALAGAIGGRFSEDQMREIRRSLALKMYQVVAREFRTSYEGQSKAGANGDQIVFIWDTMNCDALPALLPGWVGLPEAERLNHHLDFDNEARRGFASLNASVPEDRRLIKVGEVETVLGGGEPVRADVYAPPGVAVPPPDQG